jgi:hypothetical protein
MMPDFDYGHCDSCSIKITPMTGMEIMRDLQLETPFGKQFHDHVREIAFRKYCGTCGAIAPKPKVTRVYY